jgi:hypothetical protein
MLPIKHWDGVGGYRACTVLQIKLIVSGSNGSNLTGEITTVKSITLKH